MRRTAFLTVVLVMAIAPQLLLAQPATLWEKTYGGTGYDCGHSVAQTADGGYIVGGSTGSFGAGYRDVYLIRTDASGDLLWTKTYGGTGYDCGHSVAQTADGGYIVAGWTPSWVTGDFDVYLIRTDANGNALWEKTYGTMYYDYGYSVSQTADGGFIVAGWTSSWEDDVCLIRTDANGNALWEKTYGGTDGDCGHSVAQTADSGYIVAGDTRSFGAGGGDVYLIRTDANGNALWEKTYGGTDGDCGHSVAQTADSGYIVAGDTRSFGAGGGDVYLIRTDANGNALWEKTYGGTYWDNGNSVAQTADGGFIVAGRTRSFGAGDSDVYLIRLATEVDWTVMVYCCADNDLDSEGVNDLNELEYAGSTDDVNMIYLLDRYGVDDTKLYYVLNDQNGDPSGDDMNIVSLDISDSARSWLATEEDMGNPQTIEDFVLWTMSKYPARHYLLSIWDHGSGIFLLCQEAGIFKGECFDEHGGVPEEYIDLAELREVLKAAYQANGNRKIDIVGHDVCVLGQVETHYQMEPYVAYAIASENYEPPDGWEYGYSFKDLIDNPSMAPAVLADKIVTYYGQRYGSNSKVTQAAVDLSVLRFSLVPKINDFTDELCRNVHNERVGIETAWFHAERYNFSPPSAGEDPELYHFAELIQANSSLPEELRNDAQSLLDTWSEAVIAEYHGDGAPNAHGITVWFPGNFNHNSNRDDYRTKIDFYQEDWQSVLWIYDTPVTVTLVPEATVVHRGGKLKYEMQLQNKTEEKQQFYVAAYVTMPNGKPYPQNPVLGPQLVEIKPSASIQKSIRHPIPGKAPLGVYSYSVKLATPPDYLIHEDAFTFEVIEGIR
jgi:hypothetical protein